MQFRVQTLVCVGKPQPKGWRKGGGTSYQQITTTASTSFVDSVGSGAYLYKVCAADAQNNCTSSYTNIALGATVTFPTDPTITSIVDDPTGVSVTTVKAAHITELRTAVDAVRGLAGWGAASWTYPAATGDLIHKEDVRDLRGREGDHGLGAQGLQLKTHVYAGGVEVAEQNGHEVQSMTWTYSNPVTGTTAKQTSNGYNKKEYDPFGLELGTTDPYVQHAEPDYPALAGGSGSVLFLCC